MYQKKNYFLYNEKNENSFGSACIRQNDEKWTIEIQGVNKSELFSDYSDFKLSIREDKITISRISPNISENNAFRNALLQLLALKEIERYNK